MRLLPPNPEARWTPYAWLVYLSIFLTYPFLGKASGQEWVWTVVGVCIFLPLYFWGHRLEGRRTLWAIAGITALGCIFGPFNAGASVFMVYAACFTGQVGESAVAFRYLAAPLVLIGAESWLLHLSVYFWFPGILFSTLLGSVDIHFTQQRRNNRKLRMAQDEIEHLAKIAERERIARDLHDVLGHTLSLIILKSELASKLAETDPPRAISEIQDVERISREALAEVRSAVKGYRSTDIQNEFAHARETLETAGIQVETLMGKPSLPPSYEGVLVLALREAVTNVLRHSHASRCRMRLESAGTSCELEVSDNGRGGVEPEGSGLSGMRTRIEAFGGTLVRDGGNGTSLKICLPLNTRNTIATGAA